MKLKKIKYKIALFRDTKEVTGYAIDCDLPVRLCVRNIGGEWRIDHYDTGYFIGGLCDTREKAIANGIEVVRRNIESGVYADMIRAYDRHPGAIFYSVRL